MDCRSTNRMFRDPPGISLATGEAFSKIELEYDFSDFEPSSSFGVAFGVADVPDCFHRMLLPAEMCEYFCWPSIAAGSLGIADIDGHCIDKDVLVYPCNRVLPMGFSWPPFLAQTASLHQFTNSIAPTPSHLITDQGSSWILRAGAGDVGHYVYIDNLGCFSDSIDNVTGIIDRAQRRFSDCGLGLHEVDVQAYGGNALGMTMDGRKLLTRNTWKRYKYMPRSPPSFRCALCQGRFWRS